MYTPRRGKAAPVNRSGVNEVTVTPAQTSRGIVYHQKRALPRFTSGTETPTKRLRETQLKPLPTVRPSSPSFNDPTAEDGLPNQPSFPEVKKTWSQDDFMREWMPYRTLFLTELLSQECGHPERTCVQCGQGGEWRCTDCFSHPNFCGKCLALVHARTPFHKVEKWDGTHYRSAWLWQVGVVLHLGHSGAPCPHYAASSMPDDPFLHPESESASPDIPDIAEGEDTDFRFSFGFKPKGRTLDGDKLLTVVHSNGLHTLPVRFCGCPEDAATPEWVCLLRHQLYPASFKDVRTVFTFAVLDAYYMQQVECHSSTYQFFSMLRRRTNKVFPHTIPDRERELGRVGRQWLWLKERKWFGFGHDSREPAHGEMALFCAACPQPGVNLASDWKSDKENNEWKYMRSFVMDGNFSCVHQANRGEHAETWLKDGEGFMAARGPYESHLRTAHQIKQTPTCNEHKAAEDQWQVHKGCDVTGIGALACMRHGAYAPGSVVDFQKGERQMNMDWGVAQIFKSCFMEGVTDVLLAYDIACQYAVHFLERVKKSKALKESIPSTTVFHFVIGLFHVHGHKMECNARYAPTYKTGSGVRSGEILESLWEVLNQVAGRTRVMSLAHRTEVLDAAMADSNWKKMVNLVLVICREWVSKLNKAREAKVEFESLDSTVTSAQRQEWEAQAKKAQGERVRKPEAMDIYNAQISLPKSMKKKEVELMDGERMNVEGLGVTQWLALGISIQENQCSLVAFIRRHKRRMTDDRTLEVTTRRERIMKDIAHFSNVGADLFPEVTFGGDKDFFYVPLSEDQLTDDEADGDEEESPTRGSSDSDRSEPEYMGVPLPSSLTPLPTSLKKAASKERELRITQAENSLEAIRSGISHKSYLYKNRVRSATSKGAKTRARETVLSADRTVKHHVRVYEQARWALGRLHASRDILKTYQEIQKSDLNVNTPVADPNAPGQSTATLSWIWKTPFANASQRDDYLVELYRVNWLKAREIKTRWEEEIEFVVAEMEWIPRFMDYNERKWTDRASMVGNKAGHIAYAHRQASMWKSLGDHARKNFDRLLKKHPISRSSTEYSETVPVAE